MASTRTDSAFLDELRLDAGVRRLFDLAPNLHFFIKDSCGRLVHCNTLHRHGLLRYANADGIFGKENRDFYPVSLATAFSDDDRYVLSTGQPVVERVELNISHNGALNWFCTTKVPALNRRGRIIGLIGTSRRLKTADEKLGDFVLLMPAIAHIRQHYRSQIRVATLARACRMAPTTFQREFKSLFRISPGRFIIRLRIHEACLRLSNGSEPISEVALQCGFRDQNYFARQFKSVMRSSPTFYRDSRWDRRSDARVGDQHPVVSD
jgi:AraC-like DNA-binding protein